MTAGRPLVDTGGTPATANCGSPLEVSTLAGETTMPKPWVYWRVVFTHDEDGRSWSLTSRTPTTDAVSLLSTG